MAFSPERFSNNAITTLAESMTDSVLVAHVNDASNFPAEAPFRIIINDEIMRVTARAGAFFTVERGVENSTATSHTGGDTVAHIITRESFINAIEMSGVQDLRLSFSPTEAVQHQGSGTKVYAVGAGGSKVALLDDTDTRWRLHSMPSGSYLDLSSYGSGVIVDIFAYFDETNLVAKLHGQEWTNSTTRAEELSVVDGVDVMATDTGKRYVGSVHLDNTGYSLSIPSKRRLWNRDNQVPLELSAPINTTSYTYASSTVRPVNNDLANRVEFLVGISGVCRAEARASLNVYSTSGGTSQYSVGIGANSILAINSRKIGMGWSNFNATPIEGYHTDSPDKGVHTWTMMEKGVNSVSATLYGSDGAGYRNGIFGSVMA